MISLEKLSLSLIAVEFEKFHNAFEMSFNENLNRNLDFLLRQYSYELVSELYRIRNLKDEYVDLLINEHLRCLDEKWLKNGRYRSSIKSMLRRLPNLTKISCIIASDDILETIAKFCPKITEINATSSNITDDGIKYLYESKTGIVPCPEIKKLSISLYGLTNEGLKCVIRNLKSLEEINHEKFSLALYSLHEKDFPELEKVPKYNFVRLNLLGISQFVPYYKNLVTLCLTVCPKLKSLSCYILDKEQLNLFSNFYLKNLNISFKKLGQKIDIDNFLRNCGRNLVNLTVNHCVMSISQLAVSCPKLRCLSQEDVSFTEDHGDSNVIFQNLVKCDFCKIVSNRLNDKAICLLLLSSPNIKDVKFYYCYLSSKTNTYFLECGRSPVKILSIGSTKVKLSFVRDVLLHYASLERLYLEQHYYHFQEKYNLVEFAKTLSNTPRVCFV